jgi:hypothetical protein
MEQRFNDPIESLQWVVIEDHSGQFVWINFAFLKTVIYGVIWKSGIVFAAGESLFLNGGDYLAIPDQRSGRVMVVARYSENVDAHFAASTFLETAGARASAST